MLKYNIIFEYTFNSTTVYNLTEFYEKKTLTQFIITHYRDSTCGIEGGTTLALFKNTVNMKTRLAEGTALPREFQRT
jgi:hypothetical protein